MVWTKPSTSWGCSIMGMAWMPLIQGMPNLALSTSPPEASRMGSPDWGRRTPLREVLLPAMSWVLERSQVADVLVLPEEEAVEALVAHGGLGAVQAFAAQGGEVVALFPVDGRLSFAVGRRHRRSSAPPDGGD